MQLRDDLVISSKAPWQRGSTRSQRAFGRVLADIP
jgi:hypothetical protein